MANKVKPIWQDYYVYFNTEDSPVNYSIHLDDEVIFYGKAWCPPSYNEETYSTKINNICENYLTNEFQGFVGITNGKTVIHNDAIKTFQIYNEDTNILMDEVTFIYDWSYDKSVEYYTTTNMSKPINGKGKDGMYFLTTTFNNSIVSTYASKTPTDGYTLINDCNSKWALYYLNRCGGWDSYLIEGYVSKKNKFTRNNINKAYNNNTTEFGNTPYLTEISAAYEIHTGWMNERESEILADNVFQSTRLFLHNLETDNIIPVVVTDADALYKNKNNSGRKLINYTINVVASQKEYNKN